ncbi:hypothetical protein CJJ07_003166 [Candidozyma auris]|nr:hypothetical protein CJJ07_003166 [[Candida] auris]QEL59879.1 hypothetical protein CJJ09_001966 [[Candida] auris]
MLPFTILLALAAPAIAQTTTYAYSDDGREYTVTLTGDKISDIATTVTTLSDDGSTRERTFLTYTGQGQRPTGDAGPNGPDESDSSDEDDLDDDAEDLFSSDDDGVIVGLDNEQENQPGNTGSGTGSQTVARQTTMSGTGSATATSNSASAPASGTKSGSQSASGSGSKTSGVATQSETSGNEGVAARYDIGALLLGAAMALL